MSDGGRTVKALPAAAFLSEWNVPRRKGWQRCCQCHRCCSSVPGCWQLSDKQDAQGRGCGLCCPCCSSRMSLELSETLLVFVNMCTHTYFIVSSLLILFHRSRKTVSIGSSTCESSLNNLLK